jgi:hypothetical protein
VETTSFIWKKGLFLITVYLCIFLCRGEAQQLSPIRALTVPADLNNNSTTLPLFFEKERPIGSAYLSKTWMRGKVEFSDHRVIPTPDQNIFFNFDKLNNILYVLEDLRKLDHYSMDSILRFELAASDKDYSFEKVSWISNNYYLMPIIKSTKGYSLYKRLLTKISSADYTNQGYTSTGKKYDEYTDYYEYYIIFPGNKSYRKLYLKENNVRRVFKDESTLINEFFTLHDNEITEQSLLGIVQFIDDKKYPEL